MLLDVIDQSVEDFLRSCIFSASVPLPESSGSPTTDTQRIDLGSGMHQHLLTVEDALAAVPREQPDVCVKSYLPMHMSVHMSTHVYAHACASRFLSGCVDQVIDTVVACSSNDALPSTLTTEAGPLQTSMAHVYMLGPLQAETAHGMPRAGMYAAYHLHGMLRASDAYAACSAACLLQA